MNANPLFLKIIQEGIPRKQTLLQKRIQVFFCNVRNFYRKSLFFIVTDHLINLLQILYQIIENIWRKIYF